MFSKLLKKSLILISLIFTSCGNFFAPDINEKAAAILNITPTTQL